MASSLPFTCHLRGHTKSPWPMASSLPFTCHLRGHTKSPLLLSLRSFLAFLPRRSFSTSVQPNAGQDTHLRYTTLSFYRFVRLPPPSLEHGEQNGEGEGEEEGLAKLREELQSDWGAVGAVGRVYLATEGLNAQLSVPSDHMGRFCQSLDRRPAVFGPPGSLYLNLAPSCAAGGTRPAFRRLSVKVRPQIVTVPEELLSCLQDGKRADEKEDEERKG